MSHNHALLLDVVAKAVPDREAIVFRDRRVTYGQLRDRTHRFANALLEMGIRTPAPRSSLANWESGQDHVAVYLYNGNEYLEATCGANLARAVPFNVNYRYVEHELAYLLNDATPAVIVYHEAFAPTLAAVLRGQIQDRGDLSALDTNVTVMQILDAARESARTGKSVRLNKVAN